MSMIETQVLEKLTEFVGVKGSFITETSNWLSGTVDGGPNGDGTYPFTDRNGHVVYIPCPAKSIAGGGLSGATIGALKVATPFDFENAQTMVVGVGKTGGAPLQISMAMFAARMNKDLVKNSQLVGSELVASLSENGTANTAELREIHRLFTGGVINPCLPPYNAKPDCRTMKPIYLQQGLKVAHTDVDTFIASDVGKIITFSNAGGGGYALRSTIVSVDDARHITIADTAQDWCWGGEATWGTDNTVALQAALDAAAPSVGNAFGGVVLLPPGNFLTGALVYRDRAALVGATRQQSKLTYLYKASAGSAALLNNDPVGGKGVAFHILYNLGLEGCRYQQLSNAKNADVYAFTGGFTDFGDPLPFLSNIEIGGAGKRGMVTRGRHSGTVLGLDIKNCQEEGWLNASYDVNIMNVLCIANGYAGYASGFADFNEAAANCNVMNMKLSYNGTKGYDVRTTCNMLEMGSGNNNSNIRLQESPGSSLVLANTRDGNGGAQWCKFGDLGIDDTGCINYPDMTGHGGPDYLNVNRYRAMLVFSGNTVQDNHITIAYGGPAVHYGQNFASHGIYADGDCSFNSARLITRRGGGGGSFYNRNEPSGEYAAAPYLNRSSGGTGSNDFTINGVHQA